MRRVAYPSSGRTTISWCSVPRCWATPHAVLSAHQLLRPIGPHESLRDKRCIRHPVRPIEVLGQLVGDIQPIIGGQRCGILSRLSQRSPRLEHVGHPDGNEHIHKIAPQGIDTCNGQEGGAFHLDAHAGNLHTGIVRLAKLLSPDDSLAVRIARRFQVGR